MTIEKESTQSILNISEDVISKLIAKSTLEVDGVNSLGTGRRFSPYSVIRWLFTNDERIKFTNKNDRLDITVSVILKSTADSVKVAKEIQDNIKLCIQAMTGLLVNKIEVKIAGVS
ncbi:hypothetical protein FACS1894132_00760 [Clostridia bacterium]|nr:hypothetical protein FACS1894132_00760 [Clostridia bacterium]